MTSRLLRLVVLCVFRITISTATASDPIKDKVDARLRPLIESHVTPAAVVAIVTRNETRFFCYGQLSESNSVPPTPDTLFEIGSITKVFTGTLLADMVARGEVKADDPVRTCLPPNLKIPSRNGKEITLYHLATHTSALPRIPLIIAINAAHSDDPYADQDEKRFFAVLEGMGLLADPGTPCAAYSNLGVSLLGVALAHKANTSYESLLTQRILDPLKLSDTRLTLSAEQQKRFAPGHRDGKPVSHWNVAAYSPAGALRSSVADMARFLRANMGLDPSPVLPAMRDAHRPRVPLGGKTEVGYAWITTPFVKAGTSATWHNGGTGGFASFAGFLVDRPLGIVILVNSSTDENEETSTGLSLLTELTDALPNQ